MDFYCNLNHTAYKALEEAMRAFNETTHTSVAGFYHKSIRLPVGENTFEFTGPAVKAPPVEKEPERRYGIYEKVKHHQDLATEKRVPMIQRPPTNEPEKDLKEYVNRRFSPAERRCATSNPSGQHRRGLSFGRRKEDSHAYATAPQPRSMPSEAPAG